MVRLRHNETHLGGYTSRETNHYRLGDPLRAMHHFYGGVAGGLAKLAFVAVERSSVMSRSAVVSAMVVVWLVSGAALRVASARPLSGSLTPGATLWELRISEEGRCEEGQWPCFAGYSSPAVGDDGTVYVGSSDSSLYAVSPSGSVLWRFTTGGPVNGSPSIDEVGEQY